MRLSFSYDWLLLNISKNSTKDSTKESRESGFTLIELLVVVIIIGILSALALPSFLTFSRNQKLNAAQSEIFRAIQEAQTTSKRTQTGYQVSFRAEPTTQYLQYAINGVNGANGANQAYWDGLSWKTVFQDTTCPVSTPCPIIAMRGVSVPPVVPAVPNSLYYVGFGADPEPETSSTSYKVLRLRFDSKGNWDKAGGGFNPYISLRVNRNTSTTARRCITITTILGATRLLSEGQSDCPVDPN